MTSCTNSSPGFYAAQLRRSAWTPPSIAASSCPFLCTAPMIRDAPCSDLPGRDWKGPKGKAFLPGVHGHPGHRRNHGCRPISPRDRVVLPSSCGEDSSARAQQPVSGCRQAASSSYGLTKIRMYPRRHYASRWTVLHAFIDQTARPPCMLDHLDGVFLGP